jgi:hypothetical protein
MLLAFAVFMPTGALMARHEWIMGDVAAVLLALAGFS